MESIHHWDQIRRYDPGNFKGTGDDYKTHSLPNRFHDGGRHPLYQAGYLGEGMSKSYEL